MKTLIITAQPSPTGFTHTIASQYAGTKNNAKTNAEIINLYAEEYALPFLTFENSHNIKIPENAKKLQEKISKAEELVFVFPLWWGSMPAILKNFFDTVFSSGFAFSYENGKATGLLTEKKAKVIITYDAPSWVYWFMSFPIKKLIKNNILSFCGIKTTDFLTFGSIGKADENEKKEIIKTITTLALK